jgi:hypothetical protein
MQSMKERIIIERDILQSEYQCQTDREKSGQLFAAMQALSWAIDPRVAAPPNLSILAGKVQPLLCDMEGGLAAA